MAQSGFFHLRGALLASVCALAADAAWAQTKMFDVPAQPAASGVAAFARQADVQALVSAADAEGRRTNAVRGAFTPSQALERLLAGTGLAARMTGPQTYTVVRVPQDEGGPAGDPPSQLEEVVVTGSRIRGVSDLPAPALVMTGDEIRRAGYATVEDVFEALPQNFAEVTPEGRFANEGGSQVRGLNNSRVSAVDLRGLGPQSTLTLLNGARRAGSIGGRVVDVSTIPLSIVERVEVVTGGRSAVYGADAVAGVVNLITRRAFEGVETQAYYGWGDKGGERAQGSLTFGRSFERGGFVAAYDVARDWRLNLADVGLLSLRNNPDIDLTQLSLNAQADAWRQSGYLAGRYELTERVELFADGLYTSKKFKDESRRLFLGAADPSFSAAVAPSEQYSATAGAKVELGRGWRANLSATGSVAETSTHSDLFLDVYGLFTMSSHSDETERSTLSSFTAVADGPLPEVAGVTPRLALGVEAREEGFTLTRDGTRETDSDRTVRSVFAELLVPLVQDGDRPGLRRLELSLAARNDDYSDFGSSFNPQAGLVWSPAEGLTLRAAYSTAFRAPALVELATTTEVFLETAADPTAGGADRPVLFVQGTTADLLQPEEAATWSLGFDYEPTFAPWSKLSVSYFEVSYEGRIEQPSINNDRQLVLERADRFPGLIARAPTAAEAAAFLALHTGGTISNDTGRPWDPATQPILSVFPDLVMFDNRTRNIAEETVRGLDVQLSADFETGVGDLALGLNASYVLEHARSLTAASPSFSLLNEVGKPVDFRARGHVGWRRGAYDATLFVNYVDGYANPFSTPPSRMDSWTTFDLTAGFDAKRLSERSWAGDVRAQLSITNLFDERPPVFPNSLQGVLYDTTNANPFGRYVSVRVIKAW